MIFDKRVNLKPAEYPDLAGYKDAIRHSYWVHSEFRLSQDVQDFHALPKHEREAITRTMLAIAQIEVSVKTFWGDLYHHLPKPEVGAVGYSFAECHAEGTEILTPTGWRDLADIQVGDPVMQFHEDNTLTPTTVRHKTESPYTGDMYLFSKTATRALVTPNHRILYYNNKGEFRESTADQFGSHCHQFLPEAARLRGPVDELTAMDRLRIAIQADGNRRYHRRPNGDRVARKGGGAGAEYDIRVQKERKQARLEGILSQLPGVEYTVADIPSRRGMKSYMIRIDDDHNYKTFDWVDLSDKSHVWCESFIQELAEWDGYRLPDKKDCKIKYSTIDKSCADIAQAVGIGAGYRVHINTYEDTRKDSFSTCYTVSFTSGRDRVSAQPRHKSAVPYDGMVRCVTVDSGAIVTRLGDRTFIAGNSEVRHSDAYSFLLDTLGLAGEFETVTDVPAIRNRIAYLEEYLSGAKGGTDEEYAMSILLFSIFTEHVSLFGQFLIMMAFNREKNTLKGISNIVEATSKEEQIHGMFGVRLIEIIKSERPEWFAGDFEDRVRRACAKAYLAEDAILDWIFEEGELDFLPVGVIKTFMADRFNKSLKSVGVPPMLAVSSEALSTVRWFDEEIIAGKHYDFFEKRPTSYSKRTKSITEEDLF